MATKKQKEAAKENIKKAQNKWKSMSKREHSQAQPEGQARAKPGTTGEGKYFRLVIRPKEQFVTFRNQDVGEEGGDLMRLAGKRSSGSWDTQAWLINKKSAHVKKGELVADTKDVKEILQTYGPAKLIKADIFKGHPRKNVPEKDKPAAAQQRARSENIEKARAERWASN